MPFKDVPNKIDFPFQEREILKFWDETRAFEKMRAVHKDDPHWSFIDGPITANNPMGVHHGWGRTYKDLFQRFWTMRGRKLRYQNGFDCQGLWVEVEVEKEMGFDTKKDIEEFGLEQFVLACKARVLRLFSCSDRAVHPAWATGWIGMTRTSCAGWQTPGGRPIPGGQCGRSQTGTGN
jgi:isoleucyl-tRNA synthetase